MTDKAIPDMFVKNLSILISATRIKGARAYNISNCAIGILIITTWIKKARIENFHALASMSLTLSGQIFLGITKGNTIART